MRVKTGVLVESIAAADLEKSIARVLKKLNKVPLVLDSSSNDVANTYLRKIAMNLPVLMRLTEILLTVTNTFCIQISF